MTDNLPKANRPLSRMTMIREHIGTLHRHYLLWRDPLATPDAARAAEDAIGAAYAAIRELDQLIDEIKAGTGRNGT